MLVVILISPTFFKNDNKVIKNPVILTVIEPDTSTITKPTKPNITYVDTTKHIDIRKEKEKELVKEPIILVTEIKKRDLVITSIDTTGIIRKDIYNIPI